MWKKIGDAKKNRTKIAINRYQSGLIRDFNFSNPATYHRVNQTIRAGDVDILYLIILAVIQGLTEFLPVSSSGHLAMLPQITGAQDQGLMMDVAVHVGTLGAVVLYFWSDVKLAFFGFFQLLRRQKTEGSRLALLLIIATIPVVIIGFILSVLDLTQHLRNLAVIGWSMLLFGILLYIMDQRGTQTKTQANWDTKDAWKLGLWQAVALIPGASRSGMTITGARALGYSRQEGAKIAMLMSIPTIIASGTLLGVEAASDGAWTALSTAAIAAVFAFVAGFFALKLMMYFLRSISFTPYVIYRIFLGIALLWLAYS